MHKGSKGTSFVVTGEPGSGKTHLLGRLRNRVAQDRASGLESIFVYVRCNASAATLWRHLRLSLASDLLRSGSLRRLVDKRDAEIDAIENLKVSRVLRASREGRHTLAAAAWLRGELLPHSDLEALGVAVEAEEEDRDREWEAKLVAHALLRFIHPTRVILCFDQVEGLETYPGEQAGFHAFGQLVSELHAHHELVLFLSCIVSDYEDRFQTSLIKADKDRLYQHQATLKPIDWDAASRVIKARLDSSAALGEARRTHRDDPLWPLDPDALKPLFAQTGLCLPRTLIQACRRQFDECMGDDAAPQRSLPEFLQEQYDRSLAEARRAVPRLGGDKILSESLPWLLRHSGYTVLGSNPEMSQFANLAYRGKPGDSAVVFCFRPGVAFTNALKRINRTWRSPLGLKIVSDPAIHPKPGSVGAGLLSDLKRRGARQVHPLPEALAALHAIRDLITNANSGALTLDGRAITEQEVSDWVLANLPPQVEELRTALVDGPEAADATLPELARFVSLRRIVAAETAARELALPLEEVTACARRYPMHFGLLEGPPLVLFKAVEGPSPEILHA